jgi:hypothetical protein
MGDYLSVWLGKVKRDQLDPMLERVQNMHMSV